MVQKNYTREALDLKFKNVEDTSTNNAANIMGLIVKNDTDNRASLTRIELRQDHQNGSLAKLKQWQSYSIGFCTCLGLVVFSMIIPIVSSFIQTGKF